MDSRELLDRLESILDEARTGVLVTVDAQSRPHARWMTPALLPGRPGCLYAVSVPGSDKLDHLAANPAVTWLIQTRALDQIVELSGTAHVVDNPSLRNDILETVGKRLFLFWKTHENARSFVVIETHLEEASWYLPMQKRTEMVRFS